MIAGAGVSDDMLAAHGKVYGTGILNWRARIERIKMEQACSNRGARHEERGRVERHFRQCKEFESRRGRPLREGDDPPLNHMIEMACVHPQEPDRIWR